MYLQALAYRAVLTVGVSGLKMWQNYNSRGSLNREFWVATGVDIAFAWVGLSVGGMFAANDELVAAAQLSDAPAYANAAREMSTSTGRAAGAITLGVEAVQLPFLAPDVADLLKSTC